MNRILIASVTTSDEHIEIPESLSLELTPEVLALIARLQNGARDLEQPGTVIFGIDVSEYGVTSCPYNLDGEVVYNDIDQGTVVLSSPFLSMIEGREERQKEVAFVHEKPILPENYYDSAQNRIDARGLRISESTLTLWAYGKYHGQRMESTEVSIDDLTRNLQAQPSA